MNDYRKKIVDQVLNDPMYKAASAGLPEDQKLRIVKVLEQFVESFSMNLFRSFATAATAQSSQNQKIFDNMSGSVITKENG